MQGAYKGENSQMPVAIGKNLTTNTHEFSRMNIIGDSKEKLAELRNGS